MTPPTEREYDFNLVLSGPTELTAGVENALFEAGCHDATLSIRQGLLSLEFSRAVTSLKDAILSAVQDVRAAGVGAEVLRVDGCDLDTLDEVARVVAAG